MFFKIYGKLPSGKRKEKILSSPQYRNGIFQNFSETVMMAPGNSMLKTMLKFMNKPKNTTPPATIPSVKTNLHELSSDLPVITWFGHSSYFIRIDGITVLVDPVFSGNAAPVSFMVKAFDGSNVYTPEDLPPIDMLILTHDHYDHLDYKTLLRLKGKVKHIYCSLGVGAHLEHWGIPEKEITELDWWEPAKTENGIELIAAPARHFSGRGTKRAQSLWSSFILKTKGYSLYLGGDSGYDTHFKAIGEKYGPFDIAILECGQYNTAWPQIHMMPEDTAQAAIDLKAKVLLPVHWAKFSLALHPWDEPIQRVVKAAKKLRLKVTTPMIGEPVILDEVYPDKNWWEI